MLTNIIGVFFIAHGLVHSILAVAPTPDDLNAEPGTFFTAKTRSWLFQKMGTPDTVVRWVGIVLVVLATLGFLLTGLGVLGCLESV